MKKIVSALVCAALMLALSSCGDQLKKTVVTDEKATEQIAVLTETGTAWLNTDEYYYTVTDLDRNGRLEIIAACSQGTGLYTTMNIFEVNEAGDGLQKCENPDVKEGDSLPDIVANSTTCYYNAEDGSCVYIFDDILRNGAAENIISRYAFVLKDGVWSYTLLAQKHTVAQSEDDITNTYTDAEGGEIDEEQFKTVADTVYLAEGSGYTKTDISLKWSRLDGDNISEQMLECYKTFTGTAQAE